MIWDDPDMDMDYYCWQTIEDIFSPVMAQRENSEMGFNKGVIKLIRACSNSY